MLPPLAKRSIHLFALLFFTNIIIISCNYGKYSIIRSQDSKLVLDGGETEIKLQVYNGSKSQIWILDCIGSGMFYIRNKKNGKVLDVAGDGAEENNLTTAYTYGGETQKWYVNSDGSIVNAKGLAVDIRTQNFSSGANVIAYTKHGLKNQQFLIQDL